MGPPAPRRNPIPNNLPSSPWGLRRVQIEDKNIGIFLRSILPGRAVFKELKRILFK